MKVAANKPLIGHLLERLSKSRRLDKVIVAIPDTEKGNDLHRYVEQAGYEVFCGSQDDVLDRYYQAAKSEHPELIARITGDCPLMDYQVLDRMIDHFKANEFDYSCNNTQQPRFPDGLDIDLFSFRTLERVWDEACMASDREHVTTYIKKFENKFRIGHFHAPADLGDERWTVDNEEDFTLVKDIFEHLYTEGGYFTMADVLAYKKENPAIFSINKHIGRDEGLKESIQRDRKVR